MNNYGPEYSDTNVLDIMSVFLPFFIKELLHTTAELTNHNSEIFMNSKGRHFALRFLVMKWMVVMENNIYLVLNLFLLMGIVQKPTLWKYF